MNNLAAARPLSDEEKLYIISIKSKRRDRQRRQALKKAMFKQRLLGIGLILISLALVIMAFLGQTPQDKDITSVIFITLPLGLYALFTKDLILHTKQLIK